MKLRHTQRQLKDLTQDKNSEENITFNPDVIYKFRNGDIRDCYADITKISELGFRPLFSLKEGLKDLINWSDGQEAISKVEDAHRQLVEKGLVLETQPVPSK